MTRDEIYKAINGYEYGEILDTTDDYITYYDHHTDIETTVRFKEKCTDDYLKSIIYIGKGAKSHGLKEQFIVNVLKRAFGDSYFDSICTLSAIIIPSTEEEFKNMLTSGIRTSDNIDEWYDWEDTNNHVGEALLQHQIIVINEGLIGQLLKGLIPNKPARQMAYETGIIVTLLHEMGHIVTSINPIFPVDKLIKNIDEESIEEFARSTYEKLGNLKFWSNNKWFMR